MNEVQTAIAILEARGWTLAAIATEVGVTPNAVEKWKAGQRRPRPMRPTLVLLQQLSERRGIPKKRRYTPGSRVKEAPLHAE